MCAMMPMLRVRSSDVCLATIHPLKTPVLQNEPDDRCDSGAPASADRSTAQLQHRTTLPAIVRERLIGLRHSMHVFPLLHRRPCVVRRVEQGESLPALDTMHHPPDVT